MSSFWHNVLSVFTFCDVSLCHATSYCKLATVDQYKSAIGPYSLTASGTSLSWRLSTCLSAREVGIRRGRVHSFYPGQDRAPASSVLSSGSIFLADDNQLIYSGSI